MRLLTFLLLAAIGAVVLSACQTTAGPISGPVITGAAAVLAVFDQLLVGGVIEPEQYRVLTDGFSNLASLAANAEEAAKAANGRVLTPEGTAAIAGGGTAAVLGLLKAWKEFGNLRKRARSATPA